MEHFEDSLVLMDDRNGRAEAKSRGLNVVGTATVVGFSRERRLIESARVALDELTKAGYFIPAEFIETIAERVDN